MTLPSPPLDHDQFYRELTLRNAGFISADDQCGLREAVILIAGCGSTGGSVIELLVRSGAEHLILVDNGSYELNNANRQNMVVGDIVHLSQIKLPKGVEIPELALGADHDVAVVVAKHGRVEAEPAEGDESADVPATKAAKDDE